LLLLLFLQIQEHSFNTPFQLACPQFLPASDRPQGGLTYSTRLQKGDVIVAGSDGLFDNMWDTQLAELVASAVR
jgi:protein phosphatase PTC7